MFGPPKFVSVLLTVTVTATVDFVKGQDLKVVGFFDGCGVRPSPGAANATLPYA